MNDDEILAALDGFAWFAEQTGRKWSATELPAKAEQLPAKLEIVGGRLFWDDSERIRVFASLLEHLDLDLARQIERIVCQAQQSSGSLGADSPAASIATGYDGDPDP